MLVMLGFIGTSISVSIAYLTDMQSAENKAGFTENDIRIEEDFEPPDHPEPGAIVKKSPRFINESKIPVYVRVSAHFSNLQAEQFCLPLDISDDWSLHTDGYYYYYKQLSPGESSSALFDHVEFRKDLNPDLLIPFDILIYAESIQSYDMTMQEAWAFYEKNAL